MLEKLYTIPVNEAFEEADGCPFCALFKKLEANELELILGASMMEPDVREVTNKKGFCKTHLAKMHKAQKRLPLALMMESHLAEVQKMLKGPALSLKDKGETSAECAAKLADSCYVCDRVEFHFAKMLSTACLLYDQDADFRKKFKNQPFFCPEHYARYLKSAKVTMPKKRYGEFVSDVREVEEAYLAALNERVSRFCQKFDYRHAGEAWGDEKNAIEDTLTFFGVDTGEKKK
ncbi:MAG: hypothetical protein IKT43_00805 [Clostridia bacterium]|nr:hypothetical protein [Clostridia bacterium]